MINAIKQIVFDEFSKLIDTIEKDFITNYKKKNRNFLLNQLDEEMTAHMVFVSSFESKSGNAIEKCAKEIAVLRYGIENVPTYICSNDVTSNEPSVIGATQHIITNTDLTNSNLRGAISEFRQRNISRGSTPSSATQENIKELLVLSSKFKDTTTHKKPIDLAFFDGEDWNIMEIKAGGDLDSSNAPSNVEKLLTLYVGLGKENCKVYFATLYNKNGENNTWQGSVKHHLCYPDMFLIGSKFWNKILPKDITFDNFTAIYKDALEEINLNSRIHKMINASFTK